MNPQQASFQIPPENVLMALLPAGSVACVPVTGVHYLLMWHTAGAGGKPGRFNYAGADKAGVEELTAMLVKRCGFKQLPIDSAQQEILRYLLGGVLSTRNPGGEKGADLPADIRYWMEDIRDRWLTITDAHRSLYFMLTVYLGRSAPPFPTGGFPGVPQETIEYIRSAISQGDDVPMRGKRGDVEANMQNWLSKINKEGK
jgi:hypothetical protein